MMVGFCSPRTREYREWWRKFGDTWYLFKYHLGGSLIVIKTTPRAQYMGRDGVVVHAFNWSFDDDASE